MKKHFILSLMAAVLMALNVNAQEENTYSMVITLANGTSITIGPNEVSNISFNDGEITVSGAKIEEMANNIANNSADIVTLNAVVADSRTRMYTVEDKLNTNSEKINNNLGMIEQLKVEKADKVVMDAYLNTMMTDIKENRYTILGEAKITDSSGNYLTHYGYNTETGSWGEMPWTIKDIINDDYYMSRDETMNYIKYLENRIYDVVVQLRNLGLDVYF